MPVAGVFSVLAGACSHRSTQWHAVDCLSVCVCVCLSVAHEADPPSGGPQLQAACKQVPGAAEGEGGEDTAGHVRPDVLWGVEGCCGVWRGAVGDVQAQA